MSVVVFLCMSLCVYVCVCFFFCCCFSLHLSLFVRLHVLFVRVCLCMLFSSAFYCNQCASTACFHFADTESYHKDLLEPLLRLISQWAPPRALKHQHNPGSSPSLVVQSSCLCQNLAQLRFDSAQLFAFSVVCHNACGDPQCDLIP